MECEGHDEAKDDTKRNLGFAFATGGHHEGLLSIVRASVGTLLEYPKNHLNYRNFSDSDDLKVFLLPVALGIIFIFQLSPPHVSFGFPQ
ncbi:hypothetical protein RUM44_013773 [Polyplax serrata]|uniref:Uncharacterized protein n=1 Tax=Polyplax serrata TaxID=468196 RepID=A0ABR1BJC1_POLSC